MRNNMIFGDGKCTVEQSANFIFGDGTCEPMQANCSTLGLDLKGKKPEMEATNGKTIKKNVEPCVDATALNFDFNTASN